MRRTSLWILALALVAGACGSESGPSVATLDQMRVVKVSGDQASPVPDAAPSTTIYATAGASLQLLDADGYTPEPLVARVVVEGGGMGIMSGGPVVPAGTMIHWDLPEVAGKLRGLTTATDDSAHIVNRWAPGTKAGTYVASAHRILADGTITDDAEWELVVEPGEPHNLVGWQVPSKYPRSPQPGGGCDDCMTVLVVGDTVDFRDWWRATGPWVEDRHGNEIDLEQFLAEYSPAAKIMNGAFVQPGESATVIDVDANGWVLVVPDKPGSWNLVLEVGPTTTAAFVEIRSAP